MQQEIVVKTFLDRYVAAFETRDPTKVAAFYNVPCLSVRPNGEVHVFCSNDELHAFFAQVLDTYAADGMATFVPINPTKFDLGRNCTKLTCRWQMKRSDSSLIREWQQTYLFQSCSEGWCIVTSIFHQ